MGSFSPNDDPIARKLSNNVVHRDANYSSSLTENGPVLTKPGQPFIQTEWRNLQSNRNDVRTLIIHNIINFPKQLIHFMTRPPMFLQFLCLFNLFSIAIAFVLLYFI